MPNKIPAGTGKWRKVHGANVLISPGGKVLAGRAAIEAHVQASGIDSGATGGTGTSSKQIFHMGVDLTNYRHNLPFIEKQKYFHQLIDSHPKLGSHIPQYVQKEYQDTLTSHAASVLQYHGNLHGGNSDPRIQAIHQDNIKRLQAKIDEISSLDTKEKYNAYRRQQKAKKDAAEAEVKKQKDEFLKKINDDRLSKVEPHYKKTEANLTAAEASRRQLLMDSATMGTGAAQKKFFEDNFPPVAKPKVNIDVDSLAISPSNKVSNRQAVEYFDRMANVHLPDNVDFKVKVKTGVRANYQAGTATTGTVVLDRFPPGRVMVHELGHGLEHVNPIIGMVAREHVNRRTKGEAPRKLKDITGEAGYTNSEIARPDKFDHPYMGKDYGEHASEFMSMSMERIYSDAIGFAKRDPESFNFAMAVLKTDYK